VGVRKKQGIAAVDLFCGVGGKTHGLIRAGIRVTAGVDIDPTCAYAFEANNEGAQFICGNVDTLRASQVNELYPKGALRVLIGCAPCQPFSTYSQRYRHSEAKDQRWNLLSSFGRLIKGVLPDVVAAENVPDLLNHAVHARFVRALESAGYRVSESIVKCADYGVPQTRERLVILASRHGEIRLEPPTHGPSSRVTVRAAIGHLPAVVAGGPPSANDAIHRSCSLSALNAKRIAATPPGGSWRDWPSSLLLACHKRPSGKTFPSVYGRMSWDDLAPTITTQCFGLGNGRFGHPEQDRAISVREAALLQTFPPTYAFLQPGHPFTFKHLGRHIGNAVPVELGAAIGRSIMKHLGAATDASTHNVSRRSQTSLRSQLDIGL
jgi:DNA (cytosine-5)-methyltransferase 1